MSEPGRVCRGWLSKLLEPDLVVTLLDSTAKKLLFCQTVADALGLDGVQTVHARAEDAARQPQLTGQFDVVIARAVAPLNRLLPWLAPFAAPGGQIVALKGVGVAEEFAAAHPVARRLGLTMEPPTAVSLPEAEEPIVRQMVVARRA